MVNVPVKAKNSLVLVETEDRSNNIKTRECSVQNIYFDILT